MTDEIVPFPTVVPIPLETFFSEGTSQKDRVLQDLHDFLFACLPDREVAGLTFVLENGTECFVKKFSPPRCDDTRGIVYGFDVAFDRGPLSHLEFMVECTGWERELLHDAIAVD